MQGLCRGRKSICETSFSSREAILKSFSVQLWSVNEARVDHDNSVIIRFPWGLTEPLHVQSQAPEEIKLE